MFEGLGTIEGEYAIVLKMLNLTLLIPREEYPYVPLKGQVEEELKRMEALGVIRKVDVPTDWCAGMVVVPKTIRYVFV